MQTPDRRPKAFVIPQYPSDEVQRFLKEHPQANWEESLSYLLDHYPQILNGQVQYLIEGGVAVRLLQPRRREPTDVDVLTRSEQMEADFVNSRRFDVKTIAGWFGDRIMPFNWRAFDPKLGEFLFDYNEEVDFQGRSVLIMSRLALAASKSMPFRGGHAPREKQVEDLKLLNQDSDQVMIVIRRIQATYTHPTS